MSRLPTMILTIALATSGCALTTNIKVGRDGPHTYTRADVAGTTLGCAGASQRSAIWLLVASSLSATAGSLFNTAATNSYNPTLYTLLGFVSYGVSLGTNIGAWASLFRAGRYMERAGLLLAGNETEGCVDGPPPLPGLVVDAPAVQPVTPIRAYEPPQPEPQNEAIPPPTPVRRKQDDAPRSETPVRTQCTDAQIEEMKRSGLSSSAIDRACTP